MARQSRVSIVAVLVAGLTAVGCASPTSMPRSPGPDPSEASVVPSMPAANVIRGEFVVRNTTPGGAPARIETVVVRLETSRAGETSWAAVEATCDTEPPVPVSFDDRLLLGYSCRAEDGAIPDGARLRAVVEATIAGSDEVFRLESELAH